MTQSERERNDLHLAQVAFEADRAHRAALRGAAAEHDLDWSYHVAAHTPLVDRYRAIARAVADALDRDREGRATPT